MSALVLSVIKLVLVVILPITSFLYSILCFSSLYFTGEYAGCRIGRIVLLDLIQPLFIRGILIIVFCLLGVKFSGLKYNDDESTKIKRNYWIYYVVVLLISLRLSYKLIILTKRKFVDGGPNPIDQISRSGDKNENNDTNNHQPFMGSTEDLVFIITGANAGIGKETAKQLSYLAATQRPDTATTTIILACRTLSKATQVQTEIRQSIQKERYSKNVIIDVLVLELCSYQSIRNAVTSLKEKYATIHCLINNAGVMMKDKIITKDGHETTIQANHLGHFLLTCLLLPYIVPNDQYNKRTTSIEYVPRIINVTSSTYCLTKDLPIDDLNCTDRPYTLFSQYSISKLCNIIFTYTLAKQYPTIFTASVHPGLVRTDVVRNMSSFMQIGNYMFGAIVQSFQKTPAEGAWCTMNVAAILNDVSPPNSGKYWLNRHTHPIAYTKVEENSAPLWYESCRLVGLTEEEIQRIESIATNGLQDRNKSTYRTQLNDACSTEGKEKEE